MVAYIRTIRTHKGVVKLKYSFTIPGEPQGKVNMRPYERNGFLTLYNPSHNKNYMSLVRDAWYKTEAEKIADNCRIYLDINAYFQIPKSVSKQKREKMLTGLIRPTKKPDCDNISKVICDALNGIAFHDDSMIVGLTVEKLYSENPRVEVVIRSIENE